MRKAIFWLMTVVVVALGALIIAAQSKHTSPKLLIQSWFSHSGQKLSGDTNTSSGTMSRTPITTSDSASLSGTLSDEDKAQVHDFLNSVVETK